MDLRPPRYDDPLDARSAQLLYWMLWSCLLTGLAYVSFTQTTIGRETWNAVVALVAFAVALGLLYAKRLTASAAVSTLGLLAAIGLEAARFGGPSTYLPLVPTSLLALGLGAVVLQWRQILALAAVQIAFCAVLFRLEADGILPPASTPDLDGRAVPFSLAVLAVGGAFLAAASAVFRTMLAEQEASESRYRRLVEELPDGLVTVDAHGVVRSCNPAAERILGRPAAEVIGSHFTTVVHLVQGPELLEEFVRVVQPGGETSLRRVRVVRSDGTEAVLEANPMVVRSGDAVEIRVVIRDVTPRVRDEERRAELEQQLREARRLEAVGRLAGGVAHDFNNLLTVILSSAHLLEGEEGMSDDGRELVGDVDKAASRAAELTGQLLAFARRQVREPRTLDLNELVREAQSLVHRMMREDISLAVVVGSAPLPVFADPVQLEQVLVNLVVNGRDAMSSGGRLTIECAEVELTDDYAEKRAGVQPGRYAMLAVSDTGEGMDAETAEHVFEPFWSTKGDLGTGLGLATVHGIVKQSGGHVFVYSEPGQGTTFKVYLPVTDRPLDVPPPPATEERTVRPSTTVLLVDDDRAVLAMSRRVLERAGFTVLAAEGPTEAIAASQAHRGRIHVLVTDVVMPRMGGVELAERLTVGRPGMKVLFTSGYTENAIVHHGVLDAGIAFLPKPYTPTALVGRISEVLEVSFDE